MAKWYVGMGLTVTSLVLIFLMFYFPMFQPWWYYEEVEHTTNDQELSMTYNYGLQSGYVETNYEVDFDGDGENETQSPVYKYNKPLNESENQYQAQFYMNSPSEEGGKEKTLQTWTNIYYLVILSLILTVAAVVVFPFAGTGKIGTGPPKALCVIAGVLLILAAFYAVFGIPYAIDQDDQAYEKQYFKDEHDGILTSEYQHEAPNGSDFYWGGKETTFEQHPLLLKQTSTWGAGLGWYFSVVCFVLLLIASGNVYPSEKKEKKKKGRKCPQCGAPVRWISNRGAWYCNRCMEYFDEHGRHLSRQGKPTVKEEIIEEPVIISEKKRRKTKELDEIASESKDEDDLDW